MTAARGRHESVPAIPARRAGAATQPLPTHAAARAWRALGRSEDVVAVEVLQGGTGRTARAVLRLALAGPGPASVIAKTSCRPSLQLERRLYAELLPRLGVAAPRALGTFADGDRQWMFMEDAGSETLRIDDPVHRALALRWLAGLHRVGAGFSDDALPARDAAAFGAGARRALATLVRAAEHPSFAAPGRERIALAAAALERALASWLQVERICAQVPATLVHGDFQPRNLLTRSDGDLALHAIDWEYAGLGVPALDLGTLLWDGHAPADLATYRDALGPCGRRVALDQVGNWVAAGRLLRSIDAIGWACANPAAGFNEGEFRHLHLYASAIDDTLDALRPA